VTDFVKIEQWTTEAHLLRDPNADPAAVAAEQGWICPHCGGLLVPTLFATDPFGRPGRGLWIAPSRHGCQAEREALARAEVAAAAIDAPAVDFVGRSAPRD